MLFRSKMIQEKLIKFATRVPVFMYLTDYREYSLKDVITQLEPGLFKKVTGLNVKDFELLVSLGVFNGPLMNDAVYKFKRYEDSSLIYTGINKHEGEKVGGYDTVLTAEEYNRLFASQQISLAEVALAFDELPQVTTDYADYEEDYDAPEEAVAHSIEAVTKPDLRKSKVEAKAAFTQPAGATMLSRAPVNTAQLVAESRPNIGLSSVKRGTHITHKTFGQGTVVRIVDDKIIVSFGKAEKMFLFPGAIHNGYLTLG